MKSLNIYSKEQIDEKLSDIEATLPPSTVDDVNKALIVDTDGEPKWTNIGSDGKVKVTFDSLERFIGYLTSNNLKLGDTLYINCIGSVQALDITAVINGTQVDVSDDEDRTSFSIPCNGVVKNTWISEGVVQSKTEIICGNLDGGVEVGNYNSAMYYTYSINNSKLSFVGVSTQEIWKADVTRFRAVLITTG